MMIEQIRYFVSAENRDSLLEARRALSQVRLQSGIPEGRILLGDPDPDGGPAVVWQCGYTDEGEMGAAEAGLMGKAEYEAARERLNGLAVRIELELYSTDDAGE